MQWTPIDAHAAAAPAPLTVRAESLPARSYFPEHEHSWGQLVYAVSGVLTVVATNRSFVISPAQAIWLPPATLHRVCSLAGAEFRSLWISPEAIGCFAAEPIVIEVASFLRALIVEAASIADHGGRDAYGERVSALILDQVRSAPVLPGALPWPKGPPLTGICEALYENPADDHPIEHWASHVGMAPRTFSRRFDAEVGISFRSWRRRMRLFKAVELLGGEKGVTQVALELGYGSTSAFVYAFRTHTGTSPNRLQRNLRNVA